MTVRSLKFVLMVLVAMPAAILITNASVRAEPDGVQFNPATTDVNQVGGCNGAAANSPICQDIVSTGNPLFGPDGILTTVAGIFGLVTGVISVFMMLIGGTRYITSGGDPQKTSTAKKTIIYAAVGVVVASIGGVLVRFILSRINQ